MNGSPLRGLVADLGGTNARFAVAAVDRRGGVTLSHPGEVRARGFETAEAALRAYLANGGGERFDFAAFACAGPVKNGRVKLTNLGWSLSEAQLAADLGIKSVQLLNDLAAVAWAAPVLGEGDLRVIAPGQRQNGVIAVLGAGTGTNCAAMVVDGAGKNTVIGGEAGHIGFAPANEREVEIWRWLSARFGRVSVERVASGPGVLNIYRALCAIEGADPAALKPEEVSVLADNGDAIAAESLDAFAMILGTVAGDFALTFGAAALYLAGGLAPHLLTGDRAAAFRHRFEAKGRFTGYMRDIGTAVIVHPHAALVGAARSVTPHELVGA